MNNISNKHSGFTIVELIIVIIVVAILATLGVVGYNIFTRQAQEAHLKSSLEVVAASLGTDKRESGDFPAALTDLEDGDDLPGSDDFDYTYTRNAQNFCLIGVSKTNANIVFSITQSRVISEGSCTLEAVTEADDEGGAGDGTGGGVGTTSEACFLFSGGTISLYYDYENNNPANAACPRAVVIPDTIGGVPVTIIDTNAMDNFGSLESKKLTSLVLPSSLQEIYAEAFRSNHLTTLIIPSGTIEIANGAFYDNDLTSVTFPTSLTTIYSAAFESNNLTSVSLYSGTYYDVNDSFDVGVTVNTY